MRYSIFLSLLVVININAQVDLKFDKRFVQSEDKWVAFQKGKDSTHSYGFIYIDEQAGLTLDLAGSFTISPDGTFIPKKFDSTAVSYKMRLQNNNVLVAFIPENKFQELQIPAIPDWLKHYKRDTNSAKRLYRWGFLYNGWGECAKALTYLERAKQAEPNYKGLAVELAYSYNCLKQYDKAIVVLQDALKENPTDAYTNKELVYALMKSDQMDKASESCRNAIAVCKDTKYNGENCYNLLYTYYTKKDRDNFNLWLKDARKWNADNDQLLNSIKAMEAELSK